MVKFFWFGVATASYRINALVKASDMGEAKALLTAHCQPSGCADVVVAHPGEWVSLEDFTEGEPQVCFNEVLDLRSEQSKTEQAIAAARAGIEAIRAQGNAELADKLAALLDFKPEPE